MFRGRLILFSLIFSLPFVEVAADEGKEAVDPVVALQEELNGYIKERNTLDSLISTQETARAAAQKKFKETEKESLQSTLDELVKSVKALEGKCESAEKQAEGKSAELSSLETESGSLDKVIAALGPSVAIYLKGQQSVVNEYVKQPYSKIDLGWLENRRGLYSEHKGDGKEFDGTIKKLDNAIAMKKEIDGFNHILEVPFVYQDVLNARERIHEIGNKKLLNSQQWDEVYNQTDAYLSRYYNGLKLFQDVLINGFYGSTAEDVIEMNCDKIKDEFQKMLKKNQASIDKRIITVPYLNRKYEEYCRQVEENPCLGAANTDAAREILSIEIEK